MSILSFPPVGAQRFSRNPNSSIDGQGLGSIRYPSPFFDIAHTYLPSSFKTMLKWCRYYFLTNPIINAVCYKMAEYPVTDLVFDDENSSLRKRWDKFFKKTLKFKKFEVEAGLDYNCYGNCFISIHYPFHKYLQCTVCGHRERVEKTKYTFRNYKFHGECARCGHYGNYEVRDHYVRSEKDVRLIRWNPEQISIEHNEATGENEYYYQVSGKLANDIKMAKRSVIEKTPQIFIEALRKNKSLLFDKNNIFHLKRPTIAQKDKGWGLPMILPVLKDTFYLQILRKAQEAIAIEHIVPLRVIFPQSASGSSDVYSGVNLSNYKRKMEQEILRWRIDNNYIPIMPIPVGQQTLGGEGRALMLSQEYRVWAEHIIAGMQVPAEFVFGGMQFSGSNVSMRILENHFLDHKADHLEMVEWIMERVGAFMGWSPISFHFAKFKMADDLQRAAYHLQLNQAGKLSDRSLLEDTDWDVDQERKRIAHEQKQTFEQQRRQALSQAEIQGEAQMVMQKFQMRAQKMAEEAMARSQLGMQAGPGVEGFPPGGEMMAGIPGQASPGAVGQMMLGEQGMGNMSGASVAQTPPAMTQPPAQDPLANEQSQISQDSVMTDSVPLSLESVAHSIAKHVDSLQDADKQAFLENVRRGNPQLHSIVMKLLKDRRGAHQSSAAMPPPEQRAPRRGNEATIQ